MDEDTPAYEEGEQIELPPEFTVEQFVARCAEDCVNG
jgi:hypothetical protein